MTTLYLVISFMFLTSIFAHFCVLCTYLVSEQQ